MNTRSSVLCTWTIPSTLYAKLWGWQWHSSGLKPYSSVQSSCSHRTGQEHIISSTTHLVLSNHWTWTLCVAAIWWRLGCHISPQLHTFLPPTPHIRFLACGLAGRSPPTFGWSISKVPRTAGEWMIKSLLCLKLKCNGDLRRLSVRKTLHTKLDFFMEKSILAGLDASYINILSWFLLELYFEVFQILFVSHFVISQNPSTINEWEWEPS